MTRVALILMLLVQPLLARVGERYEAYQARVGKPESKVSVHIYDFVAVLREGPRQVAVSVRNGIIQAEEHSPVEPQDIQGLLDAQSVSKMAVVNGARGGLTYFANPGKTHTAAYLAPEKKLRIVEVQKRDSASHQADHRMTPKPSATRSGGHPAYNYPAYAAPLTLRSTLYYVAIGIGIIAGAVAGLWLFQWLTLLIHEGGHIIAGRLVGKQIAEVRLGGGRVVRASRRGATTWYWYLNPYLGGWVMELPKAGTPSRVREFCFIAGGPLATALFLTFLIWLWSTLNPSLSFATKPSLSPMASGLESLLKWLCLSEAIVLLTVLIPARYTMYGRPVHSDGLHIWNLFFSRTETKVLSESQSLLQRAYSLVNQHRMHEALTLAQKAAQRCKPEELGDYQLSLAHLLTQAKRFAGARAIYREQLDRLAADDPKYAVVADIFATATIYENAREFYAECESILRAGLAATPGATSLEYTLAAILSELGREEEAAPLLHKSHRRGECELSIGISAAYLSTLAQRKGNVRESAKYRNRALNLLPPDHPIVRRLFPREAMSVA